MKPTIKLVLLRQQRHILVGSNNPAAGVQNYDWHSNVEE